MEDLPEYAYVIEGMNREFDQLYEENVELKKRIEILKTHMKEHDLKIIIHCFTGGKDLAKKFIDIGCHISLSGIITFKNSSQLAEAASYIPINKLLVETDSPYLSPIPNRGKTNEPSFINHTIEKLSIIRDTDKEVIIKNTTNNFKKLFNIQ